MNKLFGCMSLLALVTTQAMAADMALKTRPLPTPVYTWTGFYVGGNVGYSWGNANTDLVGNATTITSGGGGAILSSFSFADSQTQGLTGVIGGGQIGYNYEINHQWVLGFEADIQGSGERGSRTFNDPFSGSFCLGLGGSPGNFFCALSVPLNGAAATFLDAKIEWLGTVRMRGGV